MDKQDLILEQHIQLESRDEIGARIKALVPFSAMIHQDVAQLVSPPSFSDAENTSGLNKALEDGPRHTGMVSGPDLNQIREEERRLERLAKERSSKSVTSKMPPPPPPPPSDDRPSTSADAGLPQLEKKVFRRQPVEQAAQSDIQIVSPVPGHPPAPVASSTPESVLSDRANSVLGPPNDSVVSFGDFLPVDINDINIHNLLLKED
ncbi:unnamed protein product [Adineta ricciae]|uniref:Uncharacterized protein n=1 Tax=Adineta ricciae TaxID=249248 RepID=A0A816D2M3_ADIRI|nr:unnamed protein product [Adineta ricciae]